MNLYAYVLNNYTNAADPSGLCINVENSVADCTDQVEQMTVTGSRNPWNDNLLSDLGRITDKSLQSPQFRFSIDQKQQQNLSGTNSPTISEMGKQKWTKKQQEEEAAKDDATCRIVGSRVCWENAAVRRARRAAQQDVPPPDLLSGVHPQDSATVQGLSAATILYLIVSEGSRLFPPRNLVPIP
jgi:hypothetical protein